MIPRALRIPNFLHIAIAIGKLVLSQVDRLVEAFEAESLVELRSEQWHEFRFKLDHYYRVLEQVFKITAGDYLTGMAETESAVSIRAGFETGLTQLEAILDHAESVRDRLLKLEGARLVVVTNLGKKTAPGFFNSTLAPKNWKAYLSSLHGFEDELKRRLAA